MSFEAIEQASVGLCFGKETMSVGKLAARDQKIYFEYDPLFIERGLEISPFKCPLKQGLQTFDPHLFEGLPGVFNDSLPDGWGRLLIDRKAAAEGLLPEQITALNRLSHVGGKGMGALIYEPDRNQERKKGAINLDELAEATESILQGEPGVFLDQLLALSGSLAGARPKAVIAIHPDRKEIIHGNDVLPDGYESWIVKFANYVDGPDAGAIEYVYSLMAKQAGLEMAETKLLPADKGAGYFATKRFDRPRGADGVNRLHCHTASGLLHSNFRIPSLDYEDLLTLAVALTKDIGEMEKMYRLAVFNIMAHNRDDHGKNFCFLMDQSGDWRLAPAYDLTYSSGPGGEQSTTVLGQGKNPSIHDLVKLGLEAKLPRSKINSILDQTRSSLSQWRALAKEHGVSSVNTNQIAKKLIQAQ